MMFYSYSVERSTSFRHVLSLTQQISSGVYKSMYLYLFCTLDLCNTHIALLENDIVMSNSLFMIITYYSVMTDTNE